MNSDKREFESSKPSSKTVIGLVFFLTTSLALAYIVATNSVRAHTLSKAQFVCTMIEQRGKNMDDVVCVQYTNQKFHEQVIAMNKLASK